MTPTKPSSILLLAFLCLAVFAAAIPTAIGAATATLDLHGVTKDVPVTFKVVSESPLQIEGEATMSRLAFGVGEEGSITDDVKINLSATGAE